MSGPLLMSEAARAGERSSAVLEATLGLMRRRTRAVADFWENSARAVAPTDRLAVQLAYWEQMADDYTSAVAEALKPWAAEITAPAVAPTPNVPAVVMAAAPAPLAEAPAEAPAPEAASTIEASTIETPLEPASFEPAEPALAAKAGKPAKRQEPGAEDGRGVPNGRDTDLRP